ncbi:MAG: hypothetical protein HY983_01130 [Candidatus Magasanikbacteria bacterium]|nr:hypothetical protein [Candidatus Magasanikbacteria bacterium]
MNRDTSYDRGLSYSENEREALHNQRITSLLGELKNSVEHIFTPNEKENILPAFVLYDCLARLNGYTHPELTAARADRDLLKIAKELAADHRKELQEQLASYMTPNHIVLLGEQLVDQQSDYYGGAMSHNDKYVFVAKIQRWVDLVLKIATVADWLDDELKAECTRPVNKCIALAAKLSPATKELAHPILEDRMLHEHPDRLPELAKSFFDALLDQIN